MSLWNLRNPASDSRPSRWATGRNSLPRRSPVASLPQRREPREGPNLALNLKRSVPDRAPAPAQAATATRTRLRTRPSSSLAALSGTRKSSKPLTASAWPCCSPECDTSATRIGRRTSAFVRSAGVPAGCRGAVSAAHPTLSSRPPILELLPASWRLSFNNHQSKVNNLFTNFDMVKPFTPAVPVLPGGLLFSQPLRPSG